MSCHARTLLALSSLLVFASSSLGGAPAAQVGAGKAARQGAPAGRQVSSLTVSGALDFGGVEVGQTGAAQTLTVTNQGSSAVTLDGVTFTGVSAASFSLTGALGFPIALNGGESADLDIAFTPVAKGAAAAGILIERTPAVGPPVGIGLFGVGLGAPGSEVALNAGGYAYTDAGAQDWTDDFGFVGGLAYYLLGPVSGTLDPILFRDQRQGTSFVYEVPVPNGPYEVTLGFAEMQIPAPGFRIFDVAAEGQVHVDDLDLFSTAGFAQAHHETFVTEVSDGTLTLLFAASGGEATVSTIQVAGLPRLDADLVDVQFGAVASLSSSTVQVTLENTGVAPLSIDSLGLLLGPAGTPDAMTASLFGIDYEGEAGDTVHPVGQPLAPGATTALDLTFAPVTDQYDQCVLRLSGDFGDLDLTLSGLGGHEGHPFLHPVIDTTATLIDYDGDGIEEAFLDGSLSHTHEPGKALVAYEWSEGGGALASGPVATVPLALGTHLVQLVISDDNVPSDSLAAVTEVEVVSSAEVPGVLISYYDASVLPQTPSELMTSPPGLADFAEVITGTHLEGLTTLGSSPFAQDVLVRMEAVVELPNAGTYEFVVSGGSQRLLLVNGLGVLGPVALPAGRHTLDVRFAVDGAGQAPLSLMLGVDGASAATIEEAWLDHDQSALAPLISGMPAVGTSLGGNLIQIEGLGFFPEAGVTVNWGGTLLSGAALDAVSADEIVLTSPPGSGVIQVTVETPNGTSNPATFTYDPSGPVPINFTPLSNITVPEPVGGVWGPDGRFYVASLHGELTAIEFDDDYNVVSQVTYPGISGLSNPDILGITVSPWDAPSPVRVYVAHAKHFVNGGSSFTGPSPYTGQVSILTGPNFDAPQPLITGLPSSNHDHAVNGLTFDNNGDLLVCIGSNTNAGVKHPNSGDLVESPLTAAIVKAKTSKANFNGTIRYFLTGTAILSTDQVDGEIVDVEEGVDVHVFAAGLRNPYDLVYTTDGRLYASDNGPNPGFGAASTSATTELPDPWDKDEINLIEYGGYYGSPNRSRGRYDERENIYRNGTEPAIPGEFTQSMVQLNSSVDGIDEYRAATFQSQMRGDLLVQRLGSYAWRVELGPDGDTVDKFSQVTTWSGSLGLETLPGGAIGVLAQGLNYVRVYVPDDLSAVGVQIHDVTPWRGPETGGTPFVIGGVGFTAGAQVRFNGVSATVTSVSPTRIHGITPAVPGHGGDLVDVEVNVGGSTVVLDDAFRFLYPPGQEPGRWSSLADAPTFLGEVAAGVIDGVLYLVGSGGGSTYRYDFAADAWLSSAPARPFVGDHHACEVVDDKLYLMGGLEAGSEGKVQIFDPATNLWSLGTDMPWAGGSVSTAVIDGKIHVAGGIVGSTTVTNHAVYDPTFDSWTTKPAMPVGRNHAAAGSDGRRFYVIGGRDGGNLVSNGFDDVQIYDPASDTWSWSGDGVSGLAPLPVARGGMGTAVWFQRELYVFGGETVDGPGAVSGDVYNRVDVYDPEENTWRQDTAMPTPRHGVYPVIFGSRVYLASGGTSSGTSGSDAFEAFARP